MTYGELNVDPSENIDWYTFVMISDELLNALFGFSLRRLGAELERGFSTPPSHQVVENPEDHGEQVKRYRRKIGPHEAEADSRWGQNNQSQLTALLDDCGVNWLFT